MPTAAFELLLWRSQHTNTKLRALAAQIVDELNTVEFQPDELRRQFDHVLLTAHERIDSSREKVATDTWRCAFAANRVSVLPIVS